VLTSSVASLKSNALSKPEGRLLGRHVIPLLEAGVYYYACTCQYLSELLDAFYAVSTKPDGRRRQSICKALSMLENVSKYVLNRLI
jgi:hypothetical protein